MGPGHGTWRSRSFPDQLFRQHAKKKKKKSSISQKTSSKTISKLLKALCLSLAPMAGKARQRPALRWVRICHGW